MATGAVQRGMCTCERESRSAMIECGGQPAGCGVTGPASGPKPSAVQIVLGVTGKTIGRCACEDAVDMAIDAWDRSMFSIEFEGG